MNSFGLIYRSLKAISLRSAVLHVLAIVLAGASAAVTFVVVQNIFEPEVFDPFGEYPTQSVEEPISSVLIPNEIDGTETYADFPTVSLSEKDYVTITGVKCLKNTQRSPVPVYGELRWQTVEPPGFTYEKVGGQAVREPGCTSFTFENNIPDEVLEYVNRKFSEGKKAVIFNVNGEETAVPDDDSVGETVYWRSDNFALVP